MGNPGYSQIAQNILKLLDQQNQMNCRLVSPDWKAHVDQTYFWIQKCEKKRQSMPLWVGVKIKSHFSLVRNYACLFQFFRIRR